MRPASIVLFERCYIGAWLVSLISAFFNWRAIPAAMADDPQVQRLGPGFASSAMAIGLLVGALITFVLWYFVARRGSVVAKWLVTAFFAFAVVSFLAHLAREGGHGPALAGVLGVVVLVLQGIAVAMLFRPDARTWFDSTHTPAA